MNLRIEPLTEQTKGLWDALCLRSPESWFLHTSRWLDYSLAYRPELESQSLSFFVYDGQEPVAICPLMVEALTINGKKLKMFSYGGGWAPAPAVCRAKMNFKNRGNVLNFIFDQILEMAEKYQIAKASYRLNPFVLADGGDANRSNWLSNFGFIPYMRTTQIIDTSNPPEEMHRDMRKGHRSDIKRAEGGGLSCHVFYGHECSQEIFNLSLLLCF